MYFKMHYKPETSMSIAKYLVRIQLRMRFTHRLELSALIVDKYQTFLIVNFDTF